MTRKVAIAACIVVVFVACAGGALALLVAAYEDVPSADDMPAASELPLPPDLRLTNGRCVGGSAGCWKGVQAFDVEPVAGSDASPYHCAEISDHLTSLGWMNLDPSTSQRPSVAWHYGNPAGTLRADCEIVPIDPGHGSTEVTLTWPGREEFLPFHR